MYLLNQPTTIEWVLGATPNPILVSDLNLVIIDPIGTSTFLATPILPANFTAPTSEVDGLASYIITPDIEGLWRIRLVKGTAADYQILGKVEMFVFDNTSVVNPYSPEIGSPVPYDMAFFQQGFMVASELIGQFIVTRDIYMAENDTRNKAIAEVAPTEQAQVVLIKKNDVQIGTITWELLQTVGNVVISSTIFSPGDKIQLEVAAGSIDSFIRDISVTLVGCSNISSCEIL